MKKFNCEKCGKCCEMVDIIFQGSLFIMNNNGPCKYLINNLCSIYENRPDCCRVVNSFEENKFFCKIIRKEYE